jgi:hypothetical protein
VESVNCLDKEEMESLILAAQGQTTNINYHQKNNTKQPIGSKCRMCYKAEEHTKHIAVGCTTFATAEYITDTTRWLVTSTGQYVRVCNI